MHVRKDTKLNKTLGTGSIDRSARVRRIKRVIIGLIVLAVLLPSVLCIILFIKMHKLEKQIIELSYERERVNVITESTMLHDPVNAEPISDGSSADVINVEIVKKEDSDGPIVITDTLDAKSDDKVEEEIKEVTSDDSDTSDTEQSNVDENDDEASSESADENTQILKRVYLTFDDGPSSNTKRILDILNEHNVKGTFFVVGRLSDTTTPMYKRIVDEGHAIGMHSYTHKYGEIYKNVDAFVYDVERIQSLIYEQTGILSKIYRFPGGSSNQVSRTDMSLLVSELDKRDIKYYDWNVVSGDASSAFGLSKEEIVRNCTQKALSEEEAIILMHDLPEKATTVAALPDIIEYFQSIGVEILPLTEDVTPMHHTIEMTE